MKVRVKHPVAMLLVYIPLLCLDAGGFLRLGLAASLLHECGHLIVWWRLKKCPPQLTVSPCGIGLEIGNAQLTLGGETLLAAAGPMANFVCCAVLLAGQEVKASFGNYFFAGANLLVGCFNLLPLGTLDGRILLDLLLNEIALRNKIV